MILHLNILLSQINEDYNMKPKFIKIDYLSEIILIFKTTEKENKEEIISEKVSINFKNFMTRSIDCKKVEHVLKPPITITSFDSKTSNIPQIYNATKKSQNKKEHKRWSHVSVTPKNICRICYMNSILQKIYMLIFFKTQLFPQIIKKKTKQITPTYNTKFPMIIYYNNYKKWPHFWHSTKSKVHNPNDLYSARKHSDGQNINIHTQQDSPEYYNNFWQ